MMRLLLLVYFVWFVDSISVQNKLLTRKIQSKPNDVHHALEVLSSIKNEENDIIQEDGPFLAALRVCGKSNSPDIAMQIFNQHPSRACETMLISVLGACQQYRQAVDLLLESPQKNPGSFNAALAACGKSKDWELALDIYKNHMPTYLVSTLTSSVVLKILADCRKGAETMDVLNTMPCKPDRVTYQYVFSALVRSEMLDDASQLLTQLSEDPLGVQPSEDMFDLVIAAYSKAGNWVAIQQLERLRFPNATTDSDARAKYSFQYLDSLTKVGKGKEAYREVATYLPWNVTIGVQPNRNPAKNGIRLVFYENSSKNSSQQRTKLGYLLMINHFSSNNDSSPKRSSSLLGMFLDGQHRGRGLAKVCLATWLWFCLQADITPETGVMNKPLISLLLQYRFDFRPARGGIQVEVAADPDDPNKTLVYAGSSMKSLEGAFCPRDLNHQNIRISLTPPKHRGRMVSVRTTLQAPVEQDKLRRLVEAILPKGSMDCRLTPSEIALLYLGK